MERINVRLKDVAFYTPKMVKLLNQNAKMLEENAKLLQIDFAKANNTKMDASIKNVVKY